LNRLSLRERIVLGIGLAIVVMAAGVYGFVLPAHSQFQAARGRLTASRRELTNTQHLAGLRAADQLRQANLFTPEEAAVFPAELARMAGAAQVRLASVTAQKARVPQEEGQRPPAPAQPSVPSYALYEQQIAVRVEGRYDGVRRFVTALEARRPTLLLNAVGIKLKGADASILTGDLSGELYILQPSQPAPRPAAAVAVAPQPMAAGAPFSVGPAGPAPTPRVERPEPPRPTPPVARPPAPVVKLPPLVPPPAVPGPGKETEPTAGTGGAPPTVPPTTVQAPPPEPVIVLVGTIADKRGGLAILNVEGQRRTYAVGEYIAPKARLLRVDRQQATIGVIREKGKPGERLLVPVGSRVTGVEMSPPSEQAEEQKPLPEVVSVIAGRQGRLAVLGDAGGTFQVRLGDAIPGGSYTVERIDDQGVVVTDGKVHHRLPPRKPVTPKPSGSESHPTGAAPSGG